MVAPARASGVLALAGLLFCATSSVAQELITAAELSGFEAPAADARISYGENALQFGNLRLPEGEGPHPTVVFIHGGCWLSAFDIAHAGQAEEALANAGYAVWSLEYRRVGNDGGGWPGTFLDIGAGVDHLRALAVEHALDLKRVVAVGHSAGGQLALWAAARRQIPESSPLHTAAPLPIHGVLGLAPAADLETLHQANVCGGVVDALMGGSPSTHPQRYAVASPMQLPPAGVPQRLVLGSFDDAWSPGGRAYHQSALAADQARVTLVEAPESGHFEMIIPSTTSWPLVLAQVEALFASIGEPPGDS